MKTKAKAGAKLKTRGQSNHYSASKLYLTHHWVPGKLKVHLGLAEKSFITLSEREQAKIGGRLMEVLHTVSDAKRI